MFANLPSHNPRRHKLESSVSIRSKRLRSENSNKIYPDNTKGHTQAKIVDIPAGAKSSAWLNEPNLETKFPPNVLKPLSTERNRKGVVVSPLNTEPLPRKEKRHEETEQPPVTELFISYVKAEKEIAVKKLMEQKKKRLHFLSQGQGTHSDLTEIRSKAKRRFERLESIRDDFRPWFTVTMSLLQLSIVAWECGNGGVDTISVWSYTRSYNVTESFVGRTTIEYEEKPNMWLGPNVQRLVAMGAFFPACIRREHQIQLYNAMQGITGDTDPNLGCCEREDVNAAGTTTKEDCHQLSNGVGEWRDIRCSMRTNNQVRIAHVLRPCCFGLAPKCKLTSAEHCHVIRGFFHHHAELCSEINCLEALCGKADLQFTADFIHRSTPFYDPQQWWRVILGLFLHHGLLDCGALIFLQMIVGVRLERRLGWLYVGVIYLLTGFTGQMVGSLFHCTSWPQAGGYPSLSGTVAVALATQIEHWKSLGSPLMGFLLYTFVMALVFVLGTFPRINNFSNLAGFLQGLVLVPLFLNFGKNTRRKRLKIVVVRIFYAIFTLLLVITNIAFFYEVQKLDASPTFCYIDCIPYVTRLCDKV